VKASWSVPGQRRIGLIKGEIQGASFRNPQQRYDGGSIQAGAGGAFVSVLRISGDLALCHWPRLGSAPSMRLANLPTKGVTYTIYGLMELERQFGRRRSRTVPSCVNAPTGSCLNTPAIVAVLGF